MWFSYLWKMKTNLFLLSSLVLIAACSPKPALNPEITVEDLKTHVSYLASDELMGRRGGSEYEKLAADYIAKAFERFGLEPAGTNGYYQAFPITLGTRLAEGNVVSTGEQSWSPADSSILPWANSMSGEATGPLLFVGYGIQAPDMQYDDWNGIDANGAVVLILRYGPDGASNPHSDFGAFWPLRDKVKKAVAQGAAAVLISLAPGEQVEDTLIALERERMMADSDIPVMQIRPEIAAQLMAAAGQNLFALTQKIAKSKKPSSVKTDITVTVKTNLEPEVKDSHNVIGLLKGTDPDAGTIVIGAHYDHLGMGESGSLFRGPEPKIHNGADDNASGTAGMLELAEYFAVNRPRHSILFMGFGSEEMGLLGSDYYVNNPTQAMDKKRAMINMDMIGRMTDKKLLIFGVGSSPDWEQTLTAVNSDSLDLRLVPDGTGASDHTSFYNKGIPVLHYFTDTHSDYHRPSDDTEYIKFEEKVLVLNHVRRVVESIDTMSAEQLSFTQAPVTQTRTMTLGNVTLGVLPDYGYDGTGFKITGTTEGKAGAKAGLQAGDIITQLGDVKIKDIYDYMESLNKFKPGDKTTIILKRGDQELQLQVQL
jgi:aminopeptidase YwaD